MVQISSIAELKSLLAPLLKYKRRLLNDTGINLTEDEIFSYFVDKRWKMSKNLHLCDIVDDIINLEIEKTEVFNR